MMNEASEDHLSKPVSEEEAIQQYRDLLKRGDTSPEFQNFADGLKRALTAPKPEKKAKRLPAKKK